MKKCTDCKFCMTQDYGYSNWTVEGTDAECLLKLNEQLPTDRFYGENPKLNSAEECSRFIEGDGPHIDVEQYDGALENYSEDSEIKELLRLHE